MYKDLNNQLAEISDVLPSYDKDSKYTPQFTQIPIKLYRNRDLYLILNESLPLYSYLQSCIYRREHGADKYKLYDNYYVYGLLAVSVSIEKLAIVHGCCENTIRKWKSLLEEYGFIKTNYTTINIKNKKGEIVIAKPYIYILGTHVKGFPYYYANDVV
jgi:hypothetical protein